MALPFVKYTPEIEADDPDFGKNLATVVKRAEMYTAESINTEGTGQAVRMAHAQGYGLVEPEVEILGGLGRHRFRLTSTVHSMPRA